MTAETVRSFSADDRRRLNILSGIETLFETMRLRDSNNTGITMILLSCRVPLK
jgi:hypothetical protein